jgi:hypothetical protein
MTRLVRGHGNRDRTQGWTPVGIAGRAMSPSLRRGRWWFRAEAGLRKAAVKPDEYEYPWA